MRSGGGSKPRRDLGQHFLADEEALARIVAAAELDQDQVVLEIGAGTGELTAALVEEATPFAVERYRLLDELLASGGPALRGRLRDWLSDWLGLWSESAKESHALLQAATLEPEVESQRLRQSEALVAALERYYSGLPEADRDAAHDRLLVLEIMTQRILALASMARLPVGNDAVLDILTDMWLRVLASGRAGRSG